MIILRNSTIQYTNTGLPPHFSLVPKLLNDLFVRYQEIRELLATLRDSLVLFYEYFPGQLAFSKLAAMSLGDSGYTYENERRVRLNQQILYN